MSACDTCPKPGACCRGFHLPLYADHPLKILVLMAANWLPYLPVDSRYELFELDNENWATDKRRDYTYNCPALGHDGRCTIYEDRPDICRRYQPGQDQLCVVWQPPVGEAA